MPGEEPEQLRALEPATLLLWGHQPPWGAHGSRDIWMPLGPVAPSQLALPKVPSRQHLVRCPSATQESGLPVWESVNPSQGLNKAPTGSSSEASLRRARSGDAWRGSREGALSALRPNPRSQSRTSIPRGCRPLGSSVLLESHRMNFHVYKTMNY